MHGQRISNIRVSIFDQNPQRQLHQVQANKQFTVKASGKGTIRTQLDALPLAELLRGLERIIQ